MKQHDNQSKRRNNSLQFKRALVTGFVGGVLWGMVWLLLHYFNFIEVSMKAYVLQSWTRAEWTTGWVGSFVSIFVLGLLSIVIAVIYYSLLKKRNTMWTGVAYGFVLWFCVFYLFNSFFQNIPSFSSLTMDTIISSLALYILYGTFIGYSISFDYNDNRPEVR